MKDNTYDKAKWFTHLFLPALGVAIFIIGDLEVVLGAIFILMLVLEMTLQIISRRYARENEGILLMKEDVDGYKTFTLKLDKDPEELSEMNKVLFKVKKDVSQTKHAL